MSIFSLMTGILTMPFLPRLIWQLNYTCAPHQLGAQRACYQHFRGMTETERAAALAWYHGYIADPLPGSPTLRAWHVR